MNCLRWFILTLLLLMLKLKRRSSYGGEFVLFPSEGTIRVFTGFRPDRVKLKWRGKHHFPGCSQMEDTADVVSFEEDGFVLQYKLQSSIRVLEWKAKD